MGDAVDEVRQSFLAAVADVAGNGVRAAEVVVIAVFNNVVVVALYYMFDAKRLGKPVVRFHGEGTSNEPTAFAFNIDATDGWLNMRFPQDEMDNNTSIIDNTGGEIPKAGQNPNLRDGVTD